MAGSIIKLKKVVFSLFYLLFFCFLQIKTQRLNVPRVLLPIFNDFPVNFTLEVTEGGCYQWSTSRPDIVRLIPINEDYDRSCSVEVVIQTVTRDLTRKTAIILAEDVNSGHFLRCDVIVDAIFSLNIITTTRELFIEEAPEVFEVRAHDEQGNEFTTLTGIEFEWSIGNIDKKGKKKNDNLPNTVLRFMTFQESPYETPTSVAVLDSLGKTGNIILLEGVKTGTAKVTAKLLYKEYKHVPSVEVDLIIVANLIIIPSDVTVMLYDTFKYRIVQVHQGRLEEIHIPTSQYYLEPENSNILEINNIKASAYALTLGKTKVFLYDKNVHEEYGVILPTASVNVAEVAYITIAVLPHRSRSLILGYNHEIIVELFDKKDHKFYLGDGIIVTMKISDKYFNKKTATQNGTHVSATPISVGTTIVEAVLHGVINKAGKKIPISELTAKAELVIHSAVKIQPKILALPWDPTVKIRYDVALKASGGDGSYSWHSRQPSIINVSQNGALKILKKGTADITVSLVQNPHNRDSAKVHILTPKKLQIIQYNMEAAVGEIVHLHIALFGELHDGSEVREIPFNDCQDLLFEVDIPDGNFVQNDTLTAKPVSVACTTISVVSQAIGISKISVTYGRNLTDNVTISAYEPLVAVHPLSGETILAVGSSRNIIFKGGPLAWVGRPQGYRKKVRINKENVIDVIEQEYISNTEVSTFRVLCKALGEATVTFIVSNIPPFSNCKENEATSIINVVCAKPRYIHLQPEFKDSHNCPVIQDSEEIVAHSEEYLKLLVIVKDEDGRQFDNITSFNIEWSLYPYSGATMEVSVGSLEENFYDYHVPLPKNHNQLIYPKKFLEILKLKAKITGYQKNILNSFKITSEWPPFPIENDKGILVTPLIETNINIHFVNDTIITPNKLKILNDPNTKYYLQVSQGSGFYNLILSSEEIADVRYIEPTRTISITPRKSGILKIALVDLCLLSEPAQVEVEVQQLASMEIESINKIEKGKCTIAYLKLYDTNGYLMMLPSLEAIDIKIIKDNEIVDIKKVPIKEQGSAPYEKIMYLIHGIEEGETQISFSSMQGSTEVQSEIFIVQVFPPLQVLPKNLTTLVGTIYQLSTLGGPKNAEIEYFSENKNVLEINNSGVIEGISTGETKVYAKAVGVDSKGKKVNFSQDFTEIRVILLEGIKIIVPTMRIKVGATVPLWAFGIPDHLTPLIMGSMKSPLVFSWTTDSKIFKLHNMYENTGINIRYQNEVTLRGKALNPGTVTITLTATTPCNVLGGCRIQPSFTSSIKIDIFEEIHLINKDTNNGSLVLLMAPNSSLKLKTNRDKFGTTTYKIFNSGHNSEDSTDTNALASVTNIISVDKNGVLKSGENYGTGIVTITNVESYGLKQTLTVFVHIKPVHYMMLYLDSNIKIRNDEELTMLPKGMELNYIVKYYDSVGSVFNAAEIDIKTLSSRSDLVFFSQSSKNTISAKFIENGDLIVKLFNEKYPNGMFDYVHMSIADILFPIKAVVSVGDIICFSMPLLSSEGESGYWQSSAPEIISIDPLTGVGRARSPGFAQINHSLSTNLNDEIEVIVNTVEKISVVPLKGKNITGLEVFSVPLILKGKHETIKENNVLSRGLGGCRTHSTFSLNHFPFVCTVQFSSMSSSMGIKDLFIAKPRFDIVTGFYYCDIIPMGLPTVMSSTLETRIRLNVASREIKGSPVDIFYTPPMYIPIREILFISSLADEAPTALLDIYGLPYVLEHVVVETPAEVTITSHQYLSKTFLQYQLSLTQNQDEVQGRKILITNELTKQNISLLIRVPRYDQFLRISGLHWVDYMYFHRYTLGTLVILAISFFHFWKNKIKNIDVTIKNKNVFEKYSPAPKKTPCPTMNTTNTSSQGTPGSPSRAFSAFEPVYGDPRGLYTPTARRNRTML